MSNLREKLVDVIQDEAKSQLRFKAYGVLADRILAAVAEWVAGLPQSPNPHTDMIRQFKKTGNAPVNVNILRDLESSFKYACLAERANIAALLRKGGKEGDKQ